MGDADLRRAQLGGGVQRALPRATSPRARPACRSPSTCRPRPATTRTTRWPAARSARSACRSRTSARCAGCSTTSRSTEMNTSMTINATAMWLLALYQVVAEEQALDRGAAEDGSSDVHGALAGTTQNDIIKEYLSRGTYVFPPEHSLRLTTDLIAYTVNHIPKWNPINICSYHLQEAGATPTQELAYALCTAIAVLDAVRDSGQVAPEDFGDGRRPDLVLRQRRRAVRRGDVQDARVRAAVGRDHPRALRRRRTRRCAASGTASRSTRLGLTEAQPENNVQRIVLEMLGVTLSQGRPRPRRAAAGVERGARPAAAVGPAVVAAAAAGAGLRVRPAGVRRPVRGLARSSRPRSRELVAGARAEMDRVQAMGGAVAAVESGYMKQALVSSHAARRGRIESGEDKVVGRQLLRDHRAVAADRRPRRRDPGRRPGGRAVRRRGPRSAWRERARRRPRSSAALAALAEAAKSGANLMEATLVAARAGVTTGEWAGALREVFGEFRAPTGVSGAVGRRRRRRRPDRGARARSGAPARSSAAGCGCWSASRGSTATPTAPSRSRCGPATPASRWSTRASG